MTDAAADGADVMSGGGLTHPTLASRPVRVLGIVGPDGSGKTAFVDALRAQLEAAGVTLAHTHGRPQVIGRRRHPPANLNITEPQSGPVRGFLASLAKYVLGMLDFLLARRRTLSDADIWLVERPLVDYHVDPARYQLHRRVARFVHRTSTRVALPDMLVILSGNASIMAERKRELATAEVQRQLDVWEGVAPSLPCTVVSVDTTDGRPPDVLAAEFVDGHLSRAPLDWSRAPVKPFRLDVRAVGPDPSGLEIYRPIRRRAVLAAKAGTAAWKIGATPRAARPHPLVDAVAWDLDDVTGVAVLDSSGNGRWVAGFATRDGLTFVGKIGDASDQGLRREHDNLMMLEAQPVPALRTPRVVRWARYPSGAALVTEAIGPPPLTSVADVEGALAVATALADAGWTHGDLAPWNLFRDSQGGLVLVDWESARRSSEPLADIVHFLLRLGATVDHATADTALRELLAAHARFEPLLTAGGVPSNRAAINRSVQHYLRSTPHDDLPEAERGLRIWLDSKTQGTA